MYILKEEIEIIQICMLVTSGIYISFTPLLICYLMFFGPPTMVEGSYEVGSAIFPSFRLPFCLSGGFLGIGVLFFSETQHGVRNPREVKRVNFVKLWH